jgi:hypothetical protein
LPGVQVQLANWLHLAYASSVTAGSILLSSIKDKYA